jgi:hypothetical protein
MKLTMKFKLWFIPVLRGACSVIEREAQKS